MAPRTLILYARINIKKRIRKVIVYNLNIDINIIVFSGCLVG